MNQKASSSSLMVRVPERGVHHKEHDGRLRATNTSMEYWRAAGMKRTMRSGSICGTEHCRQLVATIDSSLELALASLPTSWNRRPVRVWFDIGTWKSTLTKHDLAQDSGLIVLGLEALASNLNASLQPTTPRFVRVHGACASAQPGETLVFHEHTSPSCGSLLPTHPLAPRVGKGRDTCIGDVPKSLAVRAVPLSLLIERTRAVLRVQRIEFVKIDVQGAELDCLRSAGSALRSIDNILLESQDATEASRLALYQGFGRLPETDAMLAAADGHFQREYCEWNHVAKVLREINCLYRNTQHGHAAWLWATGNRQLVDRRWGSMISYGTTPCWLRPGRLATDLLTSPSVVGARLREGRGRAREAQLRGESPLRNDTELARLRGTSLLTGRAPPHLARAQQSWCLAHKGRSWS